MHDNFGKKNFRHHFGKLGEGGRIILRKTPENQDVKVWPAFS
jgi:hypothetical protein